MSFSEDYLAEVQQVAGDLDTRMIERLAFLLAQVRAAARAAFHSRSGRKRRQCLARRK